MSPVGDTHRAMLAALRSGVVGTFDAIASHAGVCPNQARMVLEYFRRCGITQTRHASTCTPTGQRQPGRPRVVHALRAAPADVGDPLNFTRQVWR